MRILDFFKTVLDTNNSSHIERKDYDDGKLHDTYKKYLQNKGLYNEEG